MQDAISPFGGPIGRQLRKRNLDARFVVPEP